MFKIVKTEKLFEFDTIDLIIYNVTVFCEKKNFYYRKY